MTVRPKAAARRPPGPVSTRPARREWPNAWIAAGILLAVFSVRVAEVVPGAAQLRPAILTLATVVPWMIWRSGPRVIMSSFQNRFVRLLLLYVAIGIIGVPFAIYRRAAFGQIQGLIIGSLVVFSFILVPPTKKNLEALAWTFLLSAAAMGVLASLQGPSAIGRLGAGGSFDPNDLASVMATVFPFTLVRAIRGRGFPRMLALAAGAGVILVFLSTGSRGGMVGLVVGVLVLLLGLRASRMFGLVLLLAIAAPIAWSQAPPVFKERLASFATLEQDYNVTEESGRLGTWRRGIGYAVSHPVTGVGINNFWVAEGERLRSLNRAGPWHTAHNTYIQVFAELGVPGGVALLLLLSLAFKAARRLWRVPDALRKLGVPDRPEYLAAFMAFASAAFFLSQAYAFHLFGLLGILAHTDLVGRQAIQVATSRRRPI